MNGQLEKSIVLITSASDNSMKGNVIGTGFAFYQQENYTYLLTCAHVVEDVGGEENVLVNNISAEVVAIGDTQGFDLAVLRVKELLSVLPLGLIILPGELEISLKISIPGYFLWGENKVRRRKTIKGIMMVEAGEEKAFQIIKNVGEEVAIGKLKIEAGKLQKGYSGAPVVDLETGFVLGITTHMEGKDEEEGKEGTAISIEALKKIWPEVPPDVFHFYLEKFDVITVNIKGEEINRHSHKAAFFTEDLGNGVMLEMVVIPGGTFIMGSPENEEGRNYWESPQHKVTLQPFYMSKYPITQNQYQAIMGKNCSDFQGGNRPVECVSWYDATEFCQKLSQKTGKNYKLPSESQWEYACRAGTTTPFYFGETITSELANYNGKYIYGKASRGKYREETTDVGSFPPNAFGLYDMHGNVWEWCADDRHKNYQGAPTDGSAWLENDGKEHYPVLRGGSWSFNPNLCRSAIRYDSVRRDVHDYLIGFRVVCDGGRTT
ncbi:MAG: SUMF1/EgtB/PvdO family nonheme iron enzyme [Okeania sp. SIO3H1]|nr:SUMF1/EgtB/PvdO family nonheme iron enzyme [Okeania sp. SIO3H1]